MCVNASLLVKIISKISIELTKPANKPGKPKPSRIRSRFSNMLRDRSGAIQLQHFTKPEPTTFDYLDDVTNNYSKNCYLQKPRAKPDYYPTLQSTKSLMFYHSS